MKTFPIVQLFKLNRDDVEELLEEFFGKKQDGWIQSMNFDAGFTNDSIHIISAETSTQRISQNHIKFLSEAQNREYVEWGWELNAVFSDLADRGIIPYGDYIIYISW